MKTWLTLTELAQFTGGTLATGCRMKVDGREGTSCNDPYVGGAPAVRFDDTGAYALNIIHTDREILVHRSGVDHTNTIKENHHEHE